jgi:tetratricopeptide (TPR) repeat protein
LGDDQSAIRDFTRGIELQGDDPDLYTSRGNSYLRLERYPSAIADYDAAIALGPSTADSKAYNGRGWAHWKLGRKQAAIDDLQRAIVADESSTAPRYNLALILNATYRRDDALSQLDRALEQSPNDSSLLCLRADVYKELSRIVESRNDCLRAIDADPADFEPRWRLAWLQSTSDDETMRNGAEALTHATIACDATDWQNVSCLKAVAAAYAEGGRFHDAIKCQAKVVALAGDADRDEAQRRLADFQNGRRFRQKTRTQVDEELIDALDGLGSELTRWRASLQYRQK